MLTPVLIKPLMTHESWFFYLIQNFLKFSDANDKLSKTLSYCFGI